MKHQQHLPCETLEPRRLLSSSISIGTVVDTAMRQTAQEGLMVVTRKGDLSQPLVVPLIVGGTAQNVSEYGRIGPRLTIPAGERSVALPVRPVYPGPAGQSNVVTVSIGQIEGIRYGNRTASVNIVDNPDSTPPQVLDTPPVTSPFSITTDQQRNTGAFVIRRTGDLSTREVVDIEVGGTAQNGVDFGRIGNRVVFETGVGTIVLPVRRPDPTFTGDRTVTVALPGAVPTNQSSLILNGIDLTGNINPPVAIPDPVFPDPNPGVGTDPNRIVDSTGFRTGADLGFGTAAAEGFRSAPDTGFGFGVDDESLPLSGGVFTGSTRFALPGGFVSRPV